MAAGKKKARRTTTFPKKVDAYIVRNASGKLVIMDSKEPPRHELKSILVHYDGEIHWHCGLGPWEVLRKMDGKNPFAGGKHGAKGKKKGDTPKKNRIRGKSDQIVTCGFSVAVWDEEEEELLLIDPDIVVGPPMRK